MTGIIILAAGQSIRMGTPKQQLPFNGRSLLQTAIKAASGSNAEQVLVVLGYKSEILMPTQLHPKVNVVVNKNWEEGMAGSINTGIVKLIELEPLVENTIIMLCDQPYVTSELLNALMQKKASTNCGIIACAYADTIGVPALFGKFYFAHLAALKGENGAKKILQQFADDIDLIDFPAGNIDIDTPEDFEKLSNNV